MISFICLIVVMIVVISILILLYEAWSVHQEKQKSNNALNEASVKFYVKEDTGLSTTLCFTGSNIPSKGKVINDHIDMFIKTQAYRKLSTSRNFWDKNGLVCVIVWH